MDAVMKKAKRAQTRKKHRDLLLYPVNERPCKSKKIRFKANQTNSHDVNTVFRKLRHKLLLDV